MNTLHTAEFRPSLYSIDPVREAAERIVRNEVHACASYLISGLLKSSEACEAFDLDYEDDVLPLAEVTDYEEAAESHIGDLDEDELREYLDAQCVDYVAPRDEDDTGEDEGDEVQPDTLDTLRAKALDAMREQGAQDYCSENNLDPERSEVYEHWIVSGWFARKMAEQGHPTSDDICGFTIWGRATTGQSISMDHAVLQVAAESVDKAYHVEWTGYEGDPRPRYVEAEFFSDKNGFDADDRKAIDSLDRYAEWTFTDPAAQTIRVLRVL